MIQKIEFGLIQFNKIFIQLGKQGIEDHYATSSFLASSGSLIALTTSAKKSTTWSIAWSARAPSSSSLPARPNLLPQNLAMVMDWTMVLPSTSKVGSCPMAHGQGGLECKPLSRLDPLVLEDDPGLGEDQPGCLHSAHQVEVGQLHLRHGSSEFKSKESKGAGTVGFVVKEWYSQAPNQKSTLGSSFEYPAYTLSMACTHPIVTGR